MRGAGKLGQTPPLRQDATLHEQEVQIKKAQAIPMKERIKSILIWSAIFSTPVLLVWISRRLIEWLLTP